MDDQPTLYYSRALVIDQRSAESLDSGALLSLAKKRAIDPSVFDTYAPFFFGGEISSDRWDSYDTRMGMSSLTNYAKEAGVGVAYMRSHNTRADPTGHTLTGELTGTRVRADVYMIQEPESVAYIAKIRAGIVRDQSIGFFGGQFMCTICNRDMQVWWTAEGCPHILGMMYTPTDKKGKPKEGADQVKARAVVENSHLGEVSGVYDGATPGAMIDKIRAFSEQGELDRRMIDMIQVRYNIRLPDTRVFPTAKVSTMTEEEIAALRAELATARQQVATRTEEFDANSRMLTAFRAALKPALPPTIPDTVEGVEWLVAERTRLAPLADDGVAYRNDLVEQALVEGVRALGADFTRETYKVVLDSSPIATIKRMRDDWGKIAGATFPKGRQTTETDGDGGTEGGAPADPSKKRASSRAFAG